MLAYNPNLAQNGNIQGKNHTISNKTEKCSTKSKTIAWNPKLAWNPKFAWYPKLRMESKINNLRIQKIPNLAC